VWVESLEKLEQRFESNDAQREQRMARVLESMEAQRVEHRAQSQAATEQLADVKENLSRLVAELAAVVTARESCCGSNRRSPTISDCCAKPRKSTRPCTASPPRSTC